MPSSNSPVSLAEFAVEMEERFDGLATWILDSMI